MSYPEPSFMTATTSHSAVTSIVSAIADDLIAMPMSSMSSSLEEGPAGTALFLGYHYMYTKETKYLDAAVALLDCAISNASSLLPSNNLSLFGGFTGIAWVQRHFVEIGILDIDTLYDLSEIDDALVDSIPMYEHYKLVSLMYGLVGHGLYFLQQLRNNQSAALPAIEAIVDALHRQAIEDNDGIYWPDDVPKEGMMAIGKRVIANMGLAHGTPGVVCFLSTVYEAGIRREIIASLLQKAAGWLIQKGRREGDSSRVSLFPSVYCENHDPRSSSRLAWCYGDMCIALALFRAGRALADSSWQDEGLRIALFSSARDLKQSRVITDARLPLIDTAICHGTVGLNMMFAASHTYTGRQELRIRAEEWMEQTLTARNFELENIGGYSHFITRNHATHIQKNSGLLEGTAGVGLALQANYFPAGRVPLHRLFLLE